MNRMASLEELMDAGVCSFKIEGRLKEVSYVKNVTAAYSQAIEKILIRRDEFVRASSGRSVPHFSPDVNRSFNRGFTDYFLHGRTDDIWSFGTPKSIGEKMGPVKEVGRGWIKVSGFKAFHNGDGICFFNRAGELEGYRVNRVEGNRVFLFLESGEMPSLSAGTELYRNFDIEFEKVLSKESATRKIGVDILFEETASGYQVTMTDEDGLCATASVEWKKEDARTPQHDNIRTQLGKTGNTGFEVQNVDIRLEGERFIPSSLLSDLRRQVTDELEKTRLESYVRPSVGASANPVYPVDQLTYLGNVMNAQARTFYQDHGVKNIDDAFEKNTPDSGVIMYCRHCIKNAMGLCTKNPRRDMKVQEPLWLVSQDGRRFRLRFDCSKCQMEIMY